MAVSYTHLDVYKRQIDERIGIISKELGSTEADLETFKRDAGITEVKDVFIYQMRVRKVLRI